METGTREGRVATTVSKSKIALGWPGVEDAELEVAGCGHRADGSWGPVWHGRRGKREGA